MGIDIGNANAVSLNESHEYRLITGVTRNPGVSKKGKLQVKCVYRRTKDGDFERDGNPFIYALKRNGRFSITNAELYRFKPSFEQIIANMTNGMNVDFVLGMPSSSNVVTHFGRRVARKLKAVYIDDYFIKKTVGEVLAEFDMDAVRKQHKRRIKSLLNTYGKMNQESEISLKKVDNNLRHYFEPVLHNPNYSGVKVTGDVLLADDLLSTGTTLLSSEKVLAEQGVTVQGAFCLLSDLSTRK
ncbi:TPA: hypothetical protein KDZ97_003682 [Vibrio parahaemolyticus]|uniref:hypothetical protein n=1 Tax=Vibrio parahaemolyticus TaxID=670 RepID=UPI001B81C0AF|nr:hypothetical protein [Vibrio parahaemolyticus]MDF5646622.1 hypothetical protein [Vibrio parahaemolyticus]MDF5666119.1 hypothetical protein [Vibrio parahaemolyticus]WKV19372.1 hypothetical protein [Vibrio parahaemolyticus]HBC3539148.1 hypothetical protein [Vibrio parahaemolyticus]HBC3815589.1 hypothetical protein [Vibrio parahaemolyticus]